MTVQELLTRLNSIAKANPKNKELEVKFCTADGEISDISFANLVVNLNNAKSFCGLNNVYLNKTNYSTIPDDGWLSNDALISIGETFGKSILYNTSEKILSDILKCKDESEIIPTIDKELKEIFDQTLENLKKMFVVAGQGSISEVMAITAYISTRTYISLNLKQTILDAIEKKLMEKKNEK